ncbi:hypothetical protein EDB19DRAFT_1909612 [Suillus lakei]|nr:hypothetical protein EDB19DRAFT_1909612 [Suillus lakei]
MIDYTAQVVSKAEKVSVGLVELYVCSSTFTLALTSDAASRALLSNDTECIPTMNDDAADPNSPFANDNPTSSASLKPAEISCQFLQSPSSSDNLPSIFKLKLLILVTTRRAIMTSFVVPWNFTAQEVEPASGPTYRYDATRLRCQRTPTTTQTG